MKKTLKRNKNKNNKKQISRKNNAYNIKRTSSGSSSPQQTKLVPFFGSGPSTGNNRITIFNDEILSNDELNTRVDELIEKEEEMKEKNIKEKELSDEQKNYIDNLIEHNIEYKINIEKENYKELYKIYILLNKIDINIISVDNDSLVYENLLEEITSILNKFSNTHSALIKELRDKIQFIKTKLLSKNEDVENYNNINSRLKNINEEIKKEIEKKIEDEIKEENKKKNKIDPLKKIENIRFYYEKLKIIENKINKIKDKDKIYILNSEDIKNVEDEFEKLKLEIYKKNINLLKIRKTELLNNVNNIINNFKSKTPKIIKSEKEHLYERKQIEEFKEIILFGIRAEIGYIYRDEEYKDGNAMIEEGGDYKTEKLKVLYEKKKLYDELTQIEKKIDEYKKEKTEYLKLMNITLTNTTLIENEPKYSTYEGYYIKDQIIIKTKFEFNNKDWCIYINNKEHKIYEKLKIKHFYKEKYAFIIETEIDSIIKIIFNKDKDSEFNKFLYEWNERIIYEIKNRKRAIKLINEGKTYKEFIYNEGQNQEGNMRFGTNSGYYKIWDEEFKALKKNDNQAFIDNEIKFIEKNEKNTEINYISLLTEEEKELIRSDVDLSNFPKFHEYLTENITQDEKNKLFEESKLKANKINDEIDYLLNKHSVEQHTLLHEIINFDISNLIKTEQKEQDEYKKHSVEHDKLLNEIINFDISNLIEREKKAQDEYKKAIENSKNEIDAQKQKEAQDEYNKAIENSKNEIDAQKQKEEKKDAEQSKGQLNDEQQEESGESFLNNIVFTPHGFEIIIDFTKFNLM